MPAPPLTAPETTTNPSNALPLGDAIDDIYDPNLTPEQIASLSPGDQQAREAFFRDSATNADTAQDEIIVNGATEDDEIVVNGRIVAWIKAGCRENCEGYEIHDSTTHQVVTTTMWVYQQAQRQGKRADVAGPVPPVNPPPGLASHPNREQNADRTSARSRQSSHQATPAAAPSPGGWDNGSSWRDNTSWQWRSSGW